MIKNNTNIFVDKKQRDIISLIVWRAYDDNDGTIGCLAKWFDRGQRSNENRKMIMFSIENLRKI